MKNLGKTFNELRNNNAPRVIVDYLRNTLAEFVDENTTDDSDFSLLLGGTPHLVQNVNDLKEIKTYSGCMYDGPLNLDICEHVGSYVHCLYINNNAGGNSYFIPHRIWNLNRHILQSLENSKKGD